MSDDDTSDPQQIVASLKRAAAVLREAGVPFALGGGLACWAHGGPASYHDVDLMVREADAHAAQQALVTAGMRPEDPPEDWLVKVYDGDVLIDLVFRPVGQTIDDELLARSAERDVEAVRMKVMPLEDVLTTQLLAMDEHYLDYAGPLATARAVREQVDWETLRTRTKSSPYAQAFFALLEGLGVLSSRS
ncbi:MAG: nucleotidyltransferase [Mycobacteriales bacterium]|nr:nucleotidyltransferase [Frankia sp.]